MSPELRGRLRRSVERAKQLLRRAFAQQHSTELVAQSFGLGLFVAMLPTVGVGPALLLAASTVVDRVNRLSIVAATLVCNPLVKPAVYALGLALGFALLGPVDGVGLSEASLGAAPEVLLRLLVGNVLLALLVAIPGYVLAHRTVDHYRRRKGRLAS